MRKLFTALFICIAVMFAFTQAQAATFSAAPGMITASVSGETATVNWTGIGEIAYVEQYRYDNSDKKGYVLRIQTTGNTASFNVMQGDRFQLVNKNNKYMLISREFAVSRHTNVKLVGVVPECGDPYGCVLQVK